MEMGEVKCGYKSVTWETAVPLWSHPSTARIGMRSALDACVLFGFFFRHHAGRELDVEVFDSELAGDEAREE